MSDVKAIEKGTLLVESQRVEACSISMSRTDIYISGIVRAAMKKKVFFHYLRLSKNNNTSNSLVKLVLD